MQEENKKPHMDINGVIKNKNKYYKPVETIPGETGSTLTIDT